MRKSSLKNYWSLSQIKATKRKKRNRKFNYNKFSFMMRQKRLIYKKHKSVQNFAWACSTSRNTGTRNTGTPEHHGTFRNTRKTRNTPKKPGTLPRKPGTLQENQEHPQENPEHPKKTRNPPKKTRNTPKKNRNTPRKLKTPQENPENRRKTGKVQNQEP